jgi:hypothetical protein
MRMSIGQTQIMPFLLTKILELTFLCDISPAKLCSTAWVRNPKVISKLVNNVDCRVPRTSLKAIVRAFLATKSFAAGSSMYPCHMACISKSAPRDIISLSDCHPQWHRGTLDVTCNSRGLITQRPFLVFFRVRCVKYSFYGTAFACGFLVEKGCRSLQFDKTGLLRNELLMNQKKNLVLVGASVGNRA